MIARAAQWIGARRKQEDAYVAKHYRDGVLAVVCDGMGRHHDGELASSLACEAYLRAFEKLDKLPMAQRMRDALEKANEEVRLSFESRRVYGGTTLLAVFVGAGVVRWVSVGDTALYLWRHGRLIRLNRVRQCPWSLSHRSGCRCSWCPGSGSGDLYPAASAPR